MAYRERATLIFDVPSTRKDRRGNPAPLPGQNEFVNINRAGRNKGAGFKRNWETYVANIARRAAAEQGWETPDCKVKVEFFWREVNRRRDQDNIRWFEKIVLDGMQQAGVIKNDNQAHIDGFTSHSLSICPSDPGVTVFVTRMVK